LSDCECPRTDCFSGYPCLCRCTAAARMRLDGWGATWWSEMCIIGFYTGVCCFLNRRAVARCFLSLPFMVTYIAITLACPGVLLLVGTPWICVCCCGALGYQRLIVIDDTRSLLQYEYFVQKHRLCDCLPPAIVAPGISYHYNSGPGIG
jgi:hypothetical protein